MLRRADELAHPAAAASSDVDEVWDLAAVDPGRGVAVVIELRVTRRRAAYAAAVVTPGVPVVALVADELTPPRQGLELRGPGIWADQVCEEAGARWTLGLEAFAVALDDPAEALGAARGDPTPLGFDLDLDDVADGGPADPFAPEVGGSDPLAPEVGGSDPLAPEAGGSDPLAPEAGGYRRPCRVRGELLVGAGRVELDAWGHRGHVWGGGRGRAAEGVHGWWVAADGRGHPLGAHELPADAVALGEAWLPGPRRGRAVRWSAAGGTGVGWRWDVDPTGR